ncbi:hypothetical protein [Pleionea sediminis]|uniref:hypothetical protein n=1 Tax=Pleionea sediminis TaxID=2569479 RepID=UPI001185BEEC|nr:hypothetical protein [Pleionea sediminis]
MNHCKDTLIQAIASTRDSQFAILKAFEEKPMLLKKTQTEDIAQDLSQLLGDLENRYSAYLKA